MRKTRKILISIIGILLLMLAVPSMAGLAQSFMTSNNGGQTQDIDKEEDKEVIEENIEAELEESKGLEDPKELEEEEKDVEDHTEEIQEDEGNKDSKADPSKKVFLTFDDGPSNLTPEVLRILEENQIKATFFTIGKSVEKYPHLVKQAYDEGHMVLPHTYTHDYAIYTTFETYYKDLELAKESIEKVLNIELPYIFRFPGGSSNHSSFQYGGEQFMPKLTEDVREKGYYYIDWNVSSGDASPDYDKKDKMLSNVVDGAKNKDFIVVLFHDTARNTAMAEVLPEMIAQLKDQGYTFRSFKDITQEELDTMVQLKLANKPIIR